MFNNHFMQHKSVRFFALTLCLTTISSSFTSVSANPDKYKYDAPNKTYAYPSSRDNVIISNRKKSKTRKSQTNRSNNSSQRKPSNRQRNNSSVASFNLPAGTLIPTNFPSAKKILVTKDETAPFTLEVSSDVRNRSGNVVIPRGSEILGEIRPVSGGSRFVAETLILNNGREYFINGNTPIISRTENIEDGRNTSAIWQGAAAGAAAATIIAGVTGDRAIATEEVLGGAGFGALAGFLFGGTNRKELVSFDTQRDLDVTLTSNLRL